MITTTLLLLPTLILLNRAYCLLRNYRQAQKIGLPIIITLFSWQDIAWVLLSSLITPFIPFYKARNDKSNVWWVFADRNRIHERLGPAFSHVTPFRTVIFVSDVEASKELLSNWKVWIKDPFLYSIFKVFGDNVNSVNGHDWQRHRKITSYAFKEANCRMVWQSTTEQTTGMKRLGDISLAQLSQDMKRLALHVLAFAAFGKNFEWNTGLTVPEPGHRLSYAHALKGVLTNAGPALFFVASLLSNWPSWLLTKPLADLQLAISEYRQYLKEGVMQERGSAPKDNLMSALVAANEAEKDNKALSDEELYGNLFMFNAAGHETTAGSLGYAIPLLALHPKIQDWCVEEIQAVDGGYEAWPRLVRLRALQYETLRFFSPVPILPKSSGNAFTPLDIRGQQYMIPPETFVAVNMNAVHWDASIWPDADEFKPSRWIKSGIAGDEQFIGPPAGAEMMLWSFGPRVCPGKKFSQVEFVAALACLLKDTRLLPAQRSDETEEAARRRLEDVLFDSRHVLSMTVNRPEQAGIRYVARA